MNALLPFVVSGIASGAIYGLAATGLVLTYKTSGIFNFAHGAVAAAAAYLFYWLTQQLHMPWVPAFIISVLVLGPVFGVLSEILAKRLSHQSSAMKVVGTVGLILIVQGIARVKFGPDALQIPQFLPHGTETFRLGGVVITYAQVTVTVVAVVAVAALYYLFRFTRTGLVMRAVVDDPGLRALHGSNARTARRASWIIGVTFAALSGVLVAPLVGIDAVALTYLVVQAFGAAAVGYFSNIPVTFLAGIALGIADAITTKYVVTVSWLSGLPASLPFILLFIVLLVTPKRKLLPPSSVEDRALMSWRGPPRAKIIAGVAVVAAFALLPVIDVGNVSYFTTGLAQAIMLLSLGLLVRTSGQISLAQATFAGLGAVFFSQFIVNFHLPWLIAVLLAAAVVMPIGAVLAIPAIRLSGLFLALATFGFGLMVEQLFYPLGIGFTTLAQGRVMPRPSLFGGDRGFYYLVLVFLVVIAALMMWIHTARFGRLLHAISDSSKAVSVLGLNVEMTKVMVFCVSVAIAAISGILYGCTVNYATAGDPYFTSFNSLMYLALLALAPFASPWYAIFGAIPWIITAYVPTGNTTYWLNVVFGVFAIQVAMNGGTPVAPPRVRRFLDRIFPRKAEPVPAPAAGHDAAAPAAVPVNTTVLAGDSGDDRGNGLQVRDLSVRFGGLQAVASVSLDAPIGRITGLIGPNGAGKTTTFDACSGLNRSIHGKIYLRGNDVTRLDAASRGRRGLGRTFQLPQICETMTVAENVALGMESGLAGSSVWRQLVASPGQNARVRRKAAEMMDLCGITQLASEQAGNLSTGQRRLVELARCLTGPFDVLLLDEPSSGLDSEETRQFGDILQRVVQTRNCGILLVEHDMSLVMRICQYIYVLDFGRLLYEGGPADVAASDIVRAAYLGADEVGELAAEEVGELAVEGEAK
jgi:ABC-type branched-subunit amino acid transport system ATPase component/branched-subunit amino acid ABC-type transport system permease component